MKVYGSLFILICILSTPATDAALISLFNTLVYTHTLHQGFPTCGPQAACGPRGNTVQPAKSIYIMIVSAELMK